MHSLRRRLAGNGKPRLMYDGIAPDAEAMSRLKPKPKLVAGYDTGGWPWTAQDWALFPHAVRVHIVTDATVNDGDVLDWETGNESHGTPEGWITLRKSSGYYRPTVYCDRASVPMVRALAGKYELNVDYDLWVADWTGKPHVVIAAGSAIQLPCAVTQYANGADHDTSVVYVAAWPMRTRPDHKSGASRDKPVCHVADGTVSLDELASARHTTVAHLAKVTAENLSRKDEPAFAVYLARGTDNPMPKGLVFWTSHGGPVLARDASVQAPALVVEPPASVAGVVASAVTQGASEPLRD